MSSQCPTVVAARWLSLVVVCDWLVINRIELRAYEQLKSIHKHRNVIGGFCYIIFIGEWVVSIFFQILTGEENFDLETNWSIRKCVFEIETFGSMKRIKNTNVALLFHAAEGEGFNIFTPALEQFVEEAFFYSSSHLTSLSVIN